VGDPKKKIQEDIVGVNFRIPRSSRGRKKKISLRVRKRPKKEMHGRGGRKGKVVAESWLQEYSTKKKRALSASK